MHAISIVANMFGIVLGVLLTGSLSFAGDHLTLGVNKYDFWISDSGPSGLLFQARGNTRLFAPRWRTVWTSHS